jgi:hypothetical protein
MVIRTRIRRLLVLLLVLLLVKLRFGGKGSDGDGWMRSGGDGRMCSRKRRRYDAIEMRIRGRTTA